MLDDTGQKLPMAEVVVAPRVEHRAQCEGWDAYHVYADADDRYNDHHLVLSRLPTNDIGRHVHDEQSVAKLEAREGVEDLHAQPIVNDDLSKGCP